MYGGNSRRKNFSETSIATIPFNNNNHLFQFHLEFYEKHDPPFC